MNSVRISDVVRKEETANPEALFPKGKFSYVDISSIDNQLGQIIIDHVKLIFASEAPSRARKLIHANDVIVSTVRPNLNATAMVDSELDGHICSTGFAVLKTTSRILPKYLYFYTRTKHFVDELVRRDRGASYPAVSVQDVYDVSIPLPPLPVQKQIVSILEKAQELKEKREEANEKTNQILQAAFLNMFGRSDFGIDPLVNQTELISSGSTPLGGSKNYLHDGEILFIRSQNVLMSELDYSDIVYIPYEIHNNMQRTWVRNKDVLLNITGASIGRTAVYYGKDDKANVNQHVCIIRLKKDSPLIPIYLNYYLSSQKMQRFINMSNAGATRQALNFSQIGQFSIPIPPTELQNRFAEIVKETKTVKQKQTQSTQEINTLFDALMQKAFRSELGSPHVEQLEPPNLIAGDSGG